MQNYLHTQLILPVDCVLKDHIRNLAALRAVYLSAGLHGKNLTQNTNLGRNTHSSIYMYAFAGILHAAVLQ